MKSVRQIITLISIGFVIVISAYYTYFFDSFHGTSPVAKNGVLDLTEWSFEEDGRISLDGEWNFKGYTFTERAENLVQNIQVPDGWGHKLNPRTHSPIGYGTYGLLVKLPNHVPENMSLSLLNIRTAHALYVNGQLVGKGGQIGTDRASTTGQILPYSVTFQPKQNQLHIILQISNFEYYQSSGIYRKIELGSTDNIFKHKKISVAIDSIASTIFLLTGLVSLSVFFLQIHDRKLLYFGTLCCGFALFMVTHSEKILFYLFPNMMLSPAYNIQMGSTAIVVTSVLLLIRNIYPLYINKLLMNISIVLSFIYFFIIVFLHVSISSRIEHIWIYFSLILFLYILYVLTVAVLKKVQGSFYILISLIGMTGGLLDEITHTMFQKSINTTSITYSSLFIFGLTLYIMEEFKITHQRVKELNEELDMKVIERTKELEIANQKLEEMNKDLIKLSMYDSLTGIYNRFKIFDIASEVEERFKKARLPVCVAMLDIDYFKSINDTYGHSKGDLAIKTVANHILEGIRKSDHIGRIGGEEFLVLLEQTTLLKAEELLEGIRKRIEKGNVTLETGDTFQLTISIGIAEMRGNESIEHSIHRADQALYESKRKGRNQVNIST